MRTVYYLSLLATILLTCSGCTSAYWLDRGRDFNDVFHMGIGPGIGASGRVSAVQMGIVSEMDFINLRGVQPLHAFGKANTWSTAEMVLSGAEEFKGGPAQAIMQQRRKTYGMDKIFMCWMRPMNNAKGTANLPHSVSPAFYSDLEVTAGLLLAVRVGFNPGELVDFLLGFFTVDFYSDDVAGLPIPPPPPPPKPG